MDLLGDTLIELLEEINYQLTRPDINTEYRSVLEEAKKSLEALERFW